VIYAATASLDAVYPGNEPATSEKNGVLVFGRVNSLISVIGMVESFTVFIQNVILEYYF
jgi:hypothetical protein